jgi:hypothetical protein
MFRWFFSLAILGACAVSACTSDVSTTGDASPDGAPAAADDTDAQAPDVADTGADQTSEASAPDSGCAPGSSLYHQAPGCSLPPICLGDGQDACLGTYCGCDGVTFTGGCDYATKRFTHRGPCGDGGVDAGANPDADAAPVDGCAIGGDCDAGQQWDAWTCSCVPRDSRDAGGGG